MKNAELWGGLGWLAFSAFVVYAGRELGLGSVNDPGSGYLLFWIGFLMCAFSLAILWGAVAAGGPSLASLWEDARWRKVLVVVASLCAFALLLDKLGFLLAATPLMLVLLRAVDPVRWPIAIAVGIGTPLLLWWLLKRVLLIQLPAGAFGIG